MNKEKRYGPGYGFLHLAVTVRSAVPQMPMLPAPVDKLLFFPQPISRRSAFADRNKQICAYAVAEDLPLAAADDLSAATDKAVELLADDAGGDSAAAVEASVSNWARRGKLCVVGPSGRPVPLSAFERWRSALIDALAKIEIERPDQFELLLESRP